MTKAEQLVIQFFGGLALWCCIAAGAILLKMCTVDGEPKPSVASSHKPPSQRTGLSADSMNVHTLPVGSGCSVAVEPWQVCPDPIRLQGVAIQGVTTTTAVADPYVAVQCSKAVDRRQGLTSGRR